MKAFVIFITILSMLSAGTNTARHDWVGFWVSFAIASWGFYVLLEGI